MGRGTRGEGREKSITNYKLRITIEFINPQIL